MLHNRKSENCLGIGIGYYFGLIMLLLIVLGVIGIYGMGKINRNLDRIVTVDYLKIKLANDVNLRIDRLIEDIGLMMVKEPSRRIGLKQDIDTLRLQYKESLDKLETFEATDRGKDLLEAAKASLANARKANNEVIELSLSNRTNEALALFNNEAYPLNMKIKDAFRAIVLYQEGRMESSHTEAIRQFGISQITSGFIIGAALLIGILISIIIIWNSEERTENMLFLKSLLINSSVGIRVFDGFSGDCNLINPSAVQIAGGDTETMRRQNFRNLDSWRESGLLDVAEAVLKDGETRKIDVDMHTSFGKDISISYILSRFATDNIPHLLVVGRDITEEKKMEEKNRAIEEKMIQFQKFESLGVLAGGIAHDFNNLLTPIIGHAELSVMRLASDSPVLANLKTIIKAAQRAADLAGQMLAYSGKGLFVVEPLDINNLVSELIQILEVSTSKKAVLHYTPGENLPLFEADSTQMRQVIMNLVINASEAIGENPGTISIITGVVDCSHNNLSGTRLEEGMEEGTYIYLVVSDTGCGMDKETQAKIFDPFFTTKFTGRGLGLSAVTGIIRRHMGTIIINSEPGKGSRFKVLLPASRACSAVSLQSSPAMLFSKGYGTFDIGEY